MTSQGIPQSFPMAAKIKMKSYETITGRFLIEDDNDGEDDDATDEEDEGDEDMQWLDSREMNHVASGGSLVKPGSLRSKTGA